MKKAQFKIQQTSFMLIAVVLFLILIFLFWISIKYRNLHSEASSLEEDKAVLMAEFISGMTEFSCTDKQYCIDTDKLIVLKDITSYKDFWPANYIKIRKIYPESKDIECTLTNYPDCNTYTIKSGGNSSVGSFVALCRHEKIDDYARLVCELGRISIGYQIK